MIEFIILLIVLLIVYLIFKIFTSGKLDAFGVFNNSTYFMSRPNCPQLNDKIICSSTPGCKATLNGCINSYSELRKYEKPIPEWMDNNFMIIY